MALDSDKLFRGPVTIDFRDSVAPASRFSLTGIKADIPQMAITPKEDTFEVADGVEYTDDKGTTGEFVIEFEELDDTDWTTLTTYKPGATNGIDSVKITFTNLGNGSDHHITFANVVGLKKELLTGKAWKTKLTAKISAGAGVALEDFITIAHP